MRNTAETLPWGPETLDGHPIQAGKRLWWADQSHTMKPRWVEVARIDLDEGLVICTDDCHTKLMTVPEELTTNER